jgi:integrase
VLKLRRNQGAWYRSGKDAWYATLEGKKVHLRVWGKGNGKAAHAAWLKLITGQETAAARAKTATVREVLDAFLADVQPRTTFNTWKTYRQFFKVFGGGNGGRRAVELKPHEVEALSRKPTWGTSTRNDFLTAVVTAFRWATRAGLLDRNPLDSVRKPPKTSRGAKAVISASEFERLSAAAHPRLRPLLLALWLTGCRPSELTRLTAADVDFDAGVAVLAKHKTAARTGRPRVIFLSGEMLTLLRDQAVRHPTGVLFPNRLGVGYGCEELGGIVRKLRKRAKVPHATAYGFRHSFATDALTKGVPDATVAALLGLESTAMIFSNYGHLTSRTAVLREAAAKVRGNPAA